MSISWRAINYAIDHPVLANVSMGVILILGYIACQFLPVQFLPDFNPDVLVVIVTRDNASPKEMKEEVMKAVDPHLYGLENLDSIEARAQNGVCFWVLRFTVGQYNKYVIDKVRQRLDQANLTNVEYRVERPRMKHPVLSFVMTGPKRLSELLYYAMDAKRSLLGLGVDDVRVQGAEQSDIELTTSGRQLHTMGVSMRQMSQEIRDHFGDRVMGSENGLMRPFGYSSSPLHDDLGRLALGQQQTVGVSSLVEVEKQMGYQAPRVFVHNMPAISLTVNRNAGGSDIFSLQKIYGKWQSEAKRRWGDLVKIEPYEQTWKMLRYRIELLIGNGLVGLILIMTLLGVFFHISLAKWIASGIPICIAASCVMLYCVGGSINFLSTFAFVMALGIIVDDTIVVAEQAYSEFQKGVLPRQAVLRACRLMFVPIMAASMTTVASFIPLLTIPGEYGKIMIDIPRVIICVLIASIIECFLILPRHLRVSLEKFPKRLPRWQARLQKSLWDFQYGTLKNALVWVSQRAVVITSIGFFLVSLPFVLLQSGYISFSFFPSPPNNLVMMDIDFDSGVTESRVMGFLAHADKALAEVNERLSEKGQSIVKLPLQFSFQKAPKSLVQFNKGVTANHASMIVGLSLPDQRSVSNEMLINSWYDELNRIPSMKNLSITEPRAGPPVPDIKILIKGNNPKMLKKASDALKQKLGTYQGVHAISDNMPYGPLEYQLRLKDHAKALGLDKIDIERELAAQLGGSSIDKDYADEQDIKIKLRLDPRSRANAEMLSGLYIFANGTGYRLGQLVDIDLVKDFSMYYSYNGQPSLVVSAETSPVGSTTREIIADLKNGGLSEIEKNSQVKIGLETQARSQVKALAGIQSGAMIAVVLIYMVLAWVLKSYLWPLMVMMIIPVGISGALLGHYILGMNLTILSIFGVFGLTGIVVNDAIILLHKFQIAYQKKPMVEAMIQACTERFRAVILTSVTTIAGMGPLLLNQSLQAQFIIPLAVSMCAGLLMATVLLIILLPAMTALIASRNDNHKIGKSEHL
ncbi:MAG: efflux RND transporter permease subunit [Pseudomonadota bacterium]|nr:efflux RND transporter permease subunit [Pseudomonadota bacterium]